VSTPANPAAPDPAPPTPDPAPSPDPAALDQELGDLLEHQAIVKRKTARVHALVSAMVGEGGIFVRRKGDDVAFVPWQGKVRAIKIRYGDESDTAPAPAGPIPPQPAVPATIRIPGPIPAPGGGR
jgi:hypothetical protein